MTKTFAFAALAAATFVGLVSSAPAQAGTRIADLSPNVLANRCIAQGGQVFAADPTITCQTSQVVMSCEFRSLQRARCAWDGAEYLPAAERLLGVLPATSVSGSGGAAGGNGNGGGGGGGIDLPDLPIDNGGGGGGIDLPDLPLKDG